MEVEEKSNTHRVPLTTGVPQGSVLGPFVLHLNMNDRLKVSKPITLAIFADHTTLLTSGKRTDELLKNYSHQNDMHVINCLQMF